MSLEINNEQVSVVWTDENEELQHLCIISDQSLIKDILAKYKYVGMAGHSQGSTPKRNEVWNHKVGLRNDLHLHGMNFKAAKRLVDWIKSVDLGDTTVTCTIQYAGRICLLVKSRDFWETEQVYIELPSYSGYKAKTFYQMHYPNGKRYERHFRGDWAALEEYFKAAFSMMKTQTTGETNE